MRELSEAILKECEPDASDVPLGEFEEQWGDLDKAARAWAVNALQLHNGDLLRKALAVSEALVNYMDAHMEARKGGA